MTGYEKQSNGKQMGYGISYDSGGSRCDLRHLVFRQYKHTGDSGIADRGLVIADDASAWTQNLEDRSGESRESKFRDTKS